MNPARMFLESLDRRPGIREQPGSISEVERRPGQVRSCLNSGRAATAAACPFRARRRHRAIHSILGAGEQRRRHFVISVGIIAFGIWIVARGHTAGRAGNSNAG
jgi:hypothetical protein